eukprot:GHVS01064707.1.p1 GENE.GHVS01064707.1~~GHVS01064707.1.p1  ORF type:complete len:554 (-),score=89.14 GHVS01064707.1:811-2472(-)
MGVVGVSDGEDVTTTSAMASATDGLELSESAGPTTTDKQQSIVEPVKLDITSSASSSTEKMPFENVVLLSSSDRIFVFFVFSLLGCASLVVWNGVLSTLVDVNNLLDRDINQIMTNVFMTVTVLTNLLWTHFGATSAILLYVSSIGMGLSCLLFPLIMQLATGDCGKVLIILLSVVLGVCTGTLQPCSFAVAAIMPENFCGVVSFGMGLGGLMSFVLWLGIGSGIAPPASSGKREVDEVRSAFWAFFACLALMCFMAVFAFWRLRRMRWAKSGFAQVEQKNCICPNDEEQGNVKKDKSEKLDDGDDSTTTLKNEEKHGEGSTAGQPSGTRRRSSAGSVYGPDPSQLSSSNAAVTSLSATTSRPTTNSAETGGIVNSLVYNWWLFQQAWQQIAALFVTIFVTLQMFPNVGPIKWGDEGNMMVVMFGMFQTGDFIGRYLPNASRLLGRLVTLHSRAVFPLSICRLIFIPLFMACFKLGTGGSGNGTNDVLGSSAFHIILMLFLSVTNGWLCSLCLMYVPTKLVKGEDKGAACSLAVLLMLVGIMAGLWLSNLYTI